MADGICCILAAMECHTDSSCSSSCLHGCNTICTPVEELGLQWVGSQPLIATHRALCLALGSAPSVTVYYIVAIRNCHPLSPRDEQQGVAPSGHHSPHESCTPRGNGAKSRTARCPEARLGPCPEALPQVLL